MRSVLGVWVNRVSLLGNRYSWAVGTGSATVKTGLADVIVQKYIEKRTRLDKRRCFLFTSWGFLWLGGVQYMLYSRVFIRIFPHAKSFVTKSWRQKLKDRQGQLAVLKQIGVDQFVHRTLDVFVLRSLHCIFHRLASRAP